MPSKAVDLSGQTFNRWTVLRRLENSPSGQLRYLCRCSCGNEGVVQAGALKAGHSRSCGCHKRETTIARSTKHGHATGGITPTYHSWVGMMARCRDPNHRAYPDYGGRGIRVCERWHDFSNFLADMGEKPEGHSIDRVDFDGDYTPENCRWATPTEQARNKSSNRLITIDGQTKTLAEWCESAGINRGTVEDRLDNGWAEADAIFAPAGTPTDNVRSRMLTHDGKTMCVSEWARELGIPVHRIHQRLHRGASDAEALAR